MWKSTGLIGCLGHGNTVAWYQSDLFQRTHFSNFSSDRTPTRWTRIRPWFHDRITCTILGCFLKTFGIVLGSLNNHCCYRYPTGIFRSSIWSYRFIRCTGTRLYGVFLVTRMVGSTWRRYPWWPDDGIPPRLGEKFRSRSCPGLCFGAPRSQRDAWRCLASLSRGW